MTPRLPRFAAAVVLFAAAVIAVPFARAQGPSGVPSAANCTIPVFMVASPDDGFSSTVVVRDLANNPVLNSHVTLDFSACPLFVPCAIPCAGCTAFPAAHTIQKITDATGSVAFDLRLGGACPNERVSIYADGVFLGTAAFAALDGNADLSVTTPDVVRVQNAIATGDLSADFDGSGTVTAADLTIINAHLGVTCNGVVPARTSTWGALKGAYR